ncbi:hypothetical protein DERF_005436 [Dermatophagoides farinae]|uniref:Uncharacterized protein n=1 Tax=Dermatophagoides farinae TaxID=6954 RepID=A0A922I404_DERFA|nr:hypothetical protein HUG17_3561 [Dermatophagoides farinae]KAH9521809.1 hypothetical protein DERF_005436 [Dermatophagoides farinae]
MDQMMDKQTAAAATTTTTTDKTNVLEQNNNSDGQFVEPSSSSSSSTQMISEFELQQQLLNNLKDLYAMIDNFKQDLLDNCVDILHMELKRFEQNMSKST